MTSSYSAPIFVNMPALTIFVTVSQQKAVLLTGQINTLVNTGALNSGNGNALTTELLGAAASFAAGNPTLGIQQVAGFIFQVNALVNSFPLTSTFTATQAQPLISAANAIIALARPIQLVSSVGNTITAGSPST